jgi:putative SOS response-associated peptidase YedK
MCNLYSITTKQEAIRKLFRKVNRYVGNLAPVPGVFPDYPAPVTRNVGDEAELVMMPLALPKSEGDRLRRVNRTGMALVGCLSP